MPVKRVRLVDVAIEAGVSTATVSNVLAGARRGRAQPASGEAVQRVRDAASKLGYVPNEHAKATRKGYSNTVLLALGMPEDPWTAAVSIEVQHRALRHGLSTLSLVDETWYEFLQGYSPRVAFLTSSDLDPAGLTKVDHLADLGANLVVFSTLAHAERYDVISSSAYEPMKAAYRRLRERHERVHLLSTRPTEPLMSTGPFRSRILAYQEEAHAHGDVNPESRVFVAQGKHSAVGEACRRLLAERPTAVVCTTGFLATAFRDVVLRQGLRMPDDIELIAIGDIPNNEPSFLGPISNYGSPGVFERIAEIVVQRAVNADHGPYERHEFDWQFLPGVTTVA